MASKTVSLSPTPLFDLHTGQITTRFQKQLDLSGIGLSSVDSGLGKGHIVNVARQLQSNGCFQGDPDFYKKGGKSQLNPSHEQAVAFLQDEYSQRVEVMPTSTAPADGIFVWDDTTDVDKCFLALKESLAKSCEYTTIHFIVQNEAARHAIESLIKEKYGDTVGSLKINFVVTGVNANIAEIGLERLEQSGRLSKNYIMITDISLASRIGGIAKSRLTGKTFLGVAATAIKDWNVEMNLHGYEEALDNREKATIAWASYLWILKTQQVQKELSIYQANKKEKDKKTALYALAAAGTVGLLILARFAFKKMR